MLKYGSVKPTWDDSYKQLEFVKQPIKESEITQWREQGYYNESFSGSMYSSKNPMPGWVEPIAEQIGLAKPGFVIYRMNTLDIMPVHTDHFETYMKVFGVDRERVGRALVFLEDWKSGHYFEANGSSWCTWKAGDYAVWSEEVPHAASNIGIEPRYTLQITGELDL
jgi:hypothetical protein